MRFRESGSLDTSNVQDRRRGGGRAAAIGGGGLGGAALIVFLIVQLLGGGNIGGTGGTDTSQLGPILDQLGSGESADGQQLAQNCRSGADANAKRECAVVANIESIQDYWSTVLRDRYEATDTVFFSQQVNTACGAASSGVGPFYCPADRLVYIDLTFFDDLETRFGAQGGAFVDAYVIAHEYGHHVQNLLGTNRLVEPGDTGPRSGSVRLELQADCYAGAWANHAETVPDDSGQPLISDITTDDINRALDTAGRIGDDFIQSELQGGQIDESQFSHGSSEQRQKWFLTGYETGDPRQCDTFDTRDLG